jgi:ATP-binding cassette subfamily F protein 3
VIQLADLTKSFGDRTLLDHVTWQIGDGDRVGLCGPNGAGKTTLLKMLAGIDDPDSGAIVKPSALTIGYLPQDGLSHSGRTGLRGSQQRVSIAARRQSRNARHRAQARRRGGAAG